MLNYFLAVDGRSDLRGYCASYTVVPCMNAITKKILTYKLKHKVNIFLGSGEIKDFIFLLLLFSASAKKLEIFFKFYYGN